MRGIEQYSAAEAPLLLKSGWLVALAILLAACGVRHDDGMRPDTGLPTILVINHGDTSARVYRADRSYLGRVGAGESRCFTLHTPMSLVVERLDGTWRMPDFSPYSAPGWRIEIANHPKLVRREMVGSLLPAEPCQ